MIVNCSAGGAPEKAPPPWIVSLSKAADVTLGASKEGAGLRCITKEERSDIVKKAAAKW